MIGAWRSQAACGDTPAFLEYPVRAQLTICHRCPVAADCLAFAIDTGAVDTVYGGILLPPTPLIARKERS